MVLIVAVIAAGLVSASFLSQLGNSGRSTYTSSSSTTFDAQPLLSHSYLGMYLNSPHSPSPVGIASYGLGNNSGSINPYVIRTSEVVGQANISSLSATTTWNDSIYPEDSFLACDQCATLQMNANVLVETSDGNQSFWVQNVVHFYSTSEHELSGLHGLIFNQTTPTSNMSANTSGTGLTGGLNRTVYAFGSLGYSVGTYSLPLGITLKITVQVPKDYEGIRISLSDEPTSKAERYENSFNGTAYLPIINVTSAYVEVSPYSTVSNGPNHLASNYDAELVWTAFCCGQTTKFVEMDSNMSLSYLNSSGLFESFPSFYTFGSDTGESSVNLSVSQSNNAWSVTIGENDNMFLGN